MKTLCYTMKDANDWAEFSGDYNPIHFDLAWVQARGGNHLSVHGMRALLDVKHFSSQQFLQATFEADQAIKCVIRIRYPLWNNVKYPLVAGNKLGSSAILMTGGQKCITCNLSSTDRTALIQTQDTQYICANDVLNMQKTFNSRFSKLPLWIFLDAIVFKHLIENENILKGNHLTDWFPKNANLKDIFAHYSVVQTHQEVQFDPIFLQPDPFSGKSDAIKIGIQPEIVTGDIHSGLLVCIQIVAEYQHKLLSNSITLKISSTHA